MAKTAANHDVRVLVVDDDESLALSIQDGLERKGYSVTLVLSGKAGAKKIAEEEFDIVLTDLRMADVDGLALVRKVREHLPDAEVAVITGFNDVRTAQEATKLGAAHYILKPIDLAELRAIVEKSAERVRMAKANLELRRQLDERYGFEGLIGGSTKLQRVVQLLKAFAPAPAPVLIFGENGTGKELAAKALHNNSPRRNKPFVALNCAALNENLLDDEMFGHEPGAFTGGEKLRKGRFEFAHGGSLFLDEIGDMPLSLQAKLLRVLENGEVVRIGANEPIRVDVRVIAATNKDLATMIEQGEFRRDLFQRLKVGVIQLPSLRERREDLPLLIDHFLRELSAKYQKPIREVHDATHRVLSGYDWPGNVRELKHLLECMILLDHDGVLGVEDLPDDAAVRLHMQPPVYAAAQSASENSLIGRPLADVERFYTERALELTKGNREEAAKMLGIGERTLYRKIQEWKKEPE